MLKEISIDIQKHLMLLDAALHSSQLIASHARNLNIEAVESEVDNRERLVNIISSLQSKIETICDDLDVFKLTQLEIQILRSWLNDVSAWSNKMIAYDQETVDCLNQQKINTAKEIAHVFKNKEMLKGYNHSNAE